MPLEDLTKYVVFEYRLKLFTWNVSHIFHGFFIFEKDHTSTMVRPLNCLRVSQLKVILVHVRIFAEHIYFWFELSSFHDVSCKQYVFFTKTLSLIRQGFDLGKDEVMQDLTLKFGFLGALSYVLRIKKRGLAWLAIPCNSFTFMSSSQHQRSWFAPFGSSFYPWVHLGNMVCARTCLLIAVAICRSVAFFVENPLRTSLDCWPYLNFLMHNHWLSPHRTSWQETQFWTKTNISTVYVP